MFTPKLFTELKSYNKQKLTGDIFAGITVGVVALPLAMAFAIASGLPPERGIFTSIVAGIIISTLGGSKVQIGGPTGAFVIIVSGIVAQYGYNGLAICTIIAGVMLIVFGLLRLGGLIRYIPFPVTTGFTSGIALVIFSTQITTLLGIKIDSEPANFIAKWQLIIKNLNHINLTTASIGIGTIVLIVVCKKISSKIPGMLIAMVIMTVVATLFKFNIETIGSKFGDLPRMLPTPSLPKFNFSEISNLIKPAFTIAILAAIESLLSATVADGMIGGRHRSNAELMGQGVANIGSIIFGGIPATGAIARTATNVNSGGKTPVAGILHAIVLALLLLFFAPLAKLIPLAVLAGILVVVSYNMSEIKHFTAIFRGPKSDLTILLLTFLLTVLVDLTVAVEIGVVLSALLFVRRMASITDVNIIKENILSDDISSDDFSDETVQPLLVDIPEEIEVFEINGPFFFAMVNCYSDIIRKLKGRKVLILRIRNVPAIDATGLYHLKQLYYKCKKNETTLILSGINKQPHKVLKKSGLLNLIGNENCLEHIDCALNRGKELI